MNAVRKGNPPMKRAIALLLTLSLMMVSLASVAAQPSQAPVDPVEGCDYYELTGHNLCEPFASYWAANGGLMVFGYPITEAFEEVGIDTGETYLVQYFERERMEYHPALAGTEYEILLGRLGNEVLLQQGRDWTEFEKSDPSEENYIAETGFAVPQMFLDYWMSEGLDLGDPGISFRESLALFGYPISQAEIETNMAGHTVLTQWFERARFEYHPDNEPQFQVLLGLLGNEVLAGEPPPPEVMLTFITDEVMQPRHISVGGDGALYVANAGMGGDDCVVLEMPDEGANGEAEMLQNGDEEESICFGNSGSITRIADGVAEIFVDGLPSQLFGEDAVGVHSVIVTDDGDVYAAIGWGHGFTPEVRDSFGEAATYFGWIIKVEDDGSLTPIADLLQFEADENPDPTMVDSNPYSMIMDGDTFLVADAGGNSLVRAAMDGDVTLVTVFPAQMTPAPPFLGLPEGTEIPMESVPTDVVIGPDGAYYVSELTGFPFTAGSARIWRVEADGTAEVYATGFTNIGAIDFDSEGNLYVMEMVSGGLLQADPENPITAAGAIIKIHADGTRETIVSGANGLIFPTGMVIDEDDMIYVVNLGVIPGASHVARVDPYMAPEE